METKENKIVNGPVWQSLVLFFIPCWLGMLFQQFYNIADAYVVSNFVGKNAVAAVGGVGAAVNVVIGVCTSIAGGAGVVISQHYGAMKMERVKTAVRNSMALAVLGGGVLTVICVALAKNMVVWMQTPEEIVADSTTYLLVYFCALIPNLVYNFGTAILRGMGDSKRPLYILVITSIANIGLDLLFVLGLNMGVLGAAIATDISMVISAVLVIWLLLQKMPDLSQKPKERDSAYSDIFRIGLPAALQSVMYSGSNVLIQVAINSFDTTVMAAWTIYGKVDAVCWMTISAMGMAATSFAGQNFGAGKYHRVKEGAWISSGILGGMIAIMVVVFCMFPEQLFRIFIVDQEVLDIGTGMLRFLAPAFLLYVLDEILPGVLRGCGDVVVPTIASMIGICLVRVLWLSFVVPEFHTLEMVMLSYTITWGLTMVFYVFYFTKSNWLGRCVSHR